METGVPDPIYVGYMSILRQDKEKAGQMKEYMGGKVEKFRVVPEIRHRKWKEKGLMPPLLPEQTPMYNFQDLQMEIFNEIWIDGRMPVDYTTERKMEKVR